MHRFDFVALGDTVTDEFIQLKDVRIDTNRDPEDKGYKEICFRFGDKVEYESVKIIPAVGNAANAAVAATRLGLKTAFVTDIGGDDLGTKKLDALKANGVDCEYVHVHESMESNHHYVLRYKAERTILIKHWDYPYTLPQNLEPPRWLYFSSVGEHGLPYHHEIARYLKAHPEIKLAFQPGTYQINVGVEAIKDIYEETDIFFCNKEESWRILNNDEKDIVKQLVALRALGPKLAVITDGTNGAYADDGNEVWFMPMYPDVNPPVDRTGAGDAFSSTFTAAVAAGKPINEALSWAPINSMSVVQYIGAQEGLLTRKQLEKYLREASQDYTPKKIG
ncbi:carbohydrate kinase family protein [Candidatus Wolfebacteria bacterium]|nr:carbohydrate kinase family protein [Candidatus Wolfebacteria bacterium]